MALPFPRERSARELARVSQHPVSWRRLLVAGLAAAALTGVVGLLLERSWLGPTDASAAARVEALVRSDFDAMTNALASVAGSIATNPASRELGSGTEKTEAVRALFDLLASTRAASPHPDDIAVTVYDAVRGEARAWSGRPSDIPAERVVGPQDLFVTRTALGLRLVHLQPIRGAEGDTAGPRLGAVAVEHVLSRSAAGAAIQPTEETLETSIAPVHFRMRSEGAGAATRDGAFVLRTPSGEPLVEGYVTVADLQHARGSWRRTVTGWVIAVLGVTQLLLIGPLLDARAHARTAKSVVICSIAASVLLLGGSAAIWGGIVWSTSGRSGLPVNLSFCAIAAAALAALWVSPVTTLHAALRPHLAPRDAAPRFVLLNVLAGLAVAGLVLAFARILALAVDPATVDVRHFSLYPWNGARVLRLAGILALHVAALWAATLVLISARSAWRLPSPAPTTRLALLALWVLPTLVAGLVATRLGWQLPVVGLLLSALACGIAALLARRIVIWYRHATIAARIFGLFVAFLVPAVLLYPSLNFFAGLAIERLITIYSVEAQNHSVALLERLDQAKREIDALESLPDLLVVEPGDVPAAPDPKNAFYVWSQTVLGRDRLTSAVELYNGGGPQPVSRFALNLPEYTGSGQQPQASPSCQWDVFGEPLPIGSQKRLVLHAERGICQAGTGVPVGTIVLHLAVDDYRTLPFITSQSPYFELFRPSQGTDSREAAPGNDVHVAIYGWGLEPVYTSALSAWPITESLFQRIYDPARTPFWEPIPLGEDTFRVYFTNDRVGIYAIGYPQLTLFDHLVHLAEVSTLAGAAFVLVLLGTAVFTRLGRERPRVGRALLREIRASFYRKLFLAFVLASTIPVLVLALVIRAYFADLLRKDIQAEAVRTASVAQRVIEESDALLNRGADRSEPPTDDVMVWISQVIDQDVNIFNGSKLVATSERDLFSSGLLPTRTSEDVYRAIVLERLPSYVDEDQLGATPYLVAATPVRVAGGSQLILTVPAALRQRDIEREIDDLDRGVHLAVLFFVLLGAALGLSLAERIADPVRRLTRVTQRIARGDFDARIAVRSVDELRRLVDAFNSMAAELKAQRIELERTHRLEAWAEMARQVAHEIKNPLTPIQLSAEHLLRVHADKGQPLGPVLDGCVNAILSQVRLLRQIASEFSSFASSPVVRLAPADVPELVEEILNPYRAGLAGRIAIVNNANGPLPPVRVDRTLVLRALANVVENALHAMPGTGALVVDATLEDQAVVITVRDTGVGMDEEALARVFEPYFSTKTSGTGLGLPIARRNVELSGGTIEVQSQKGGGTTVRVHLPVAGLASGSSTGNTPDQ